MCREVAVKALLAAAMTDDCNNVELLLLFCRHHFWCLILASILSLTSCVIPVAENVAAAHHLSRWNPCRLVRGFAVVAALGTRHGASAAASNLHFAPWSRNIQQEDALVCRDGHTLPLIAKAVWVAKEESCLRNEE